MLLLILPLVYIDTVKRKDLVVFNYKIKYILLLILSKYGNIFSKSMIIYITSDKQCV
jgi:hypothetical protein